LEREGGARARPHVRAASLRRRLDVLGVVVAAADDDQILEPSGHQEPGAVENSEISGAQERPRTVRQTGAKQQLAFLGPAPITRGHARAADPDLPDGSGRAFSPGLRVDHRDLLIEPSAATRDQTAAFAGRFRLGKASLESSAVEPDRTRPLPHSAAGRKEGRLGQPITRIEGRAPETAGGESLAKAFECLLPDRLGTIEGHPPGREVELGPLLAGDTAYA